MSELLTGKETAELMKTSRVQVRRMIQNGELAAVKVGREYQILYTNCFLCHWRCLLAVLESLQVSQVNSCTILSPVCGRYFAGVAE